MKKVLLSLLAVAALVLSCQNYDDEFAALNAKVASLESQITSLSGLQTALTQVQSSVSALQAAVSAIPDLSSEVAAILADLESLASDVAGATTSADLDALKAELNTSLAALQALIEANSASIANLVLSNTELKEALGDLGVDVDSILAANATFEGNLTITNAAELAYAKSLGNKVSTIRGNVYVLVDETEHTGGGTGEGLTAAEVASVTSQITYVVGNVKIDSDVEVDLSKLASVSGDYIILNSDVSDDALLSVGGNVHFDYDGAYKSNIQTAGNIFLVAKAKAAAVAATSTPARLGTTSIDFLALTKATGVQTVSSTEAAAHTSGASVTYDANEADKSIALVSSTTGASTTSVKIGQAPVVSVTGGAVLDVIELHYAADKFGTKTTGVDPLASLTVSGTGLSSITVMAGKITGAVSITTTATAVTAATATVSMPNLEEVGNFTSDALENSIAKLTKSGNLTLSNDVEVSLPLLSTVTGTGGISLAKATSLSLPKLTRVGAAIATGSTDAVTAGANIVADLVSGSISFPALVKAGEIHMDAITTLTAPLAKVTAVDIEEATFSGTTVTLPVSIELGSVSSFAATPASTASAADFTSPAAITSLTLNAQDAVVDLTAFTEARTIVYKGKALSSGAAAAGTLNISTANEALTTLTLGGVLGTVVVDTATNARTNATTGANTNTALTTVTTSGTIESLTIQNNYDLTTINALHTDSTTSTTAAVLKVIDNVKLTTLKTGITTFSEITITGNYRLSSLDLSSVVALPANWSAAADQTVGNANAKITITGNYFDTAGTTTTNASVYGGSAVTASATAPLSKYTGMTGTYSPASSVAAEKFGQAGLATLAGLIDSMEAKFLATGAASADSSGIHITLDYAWQTNASTPVVETFASGETRAGAMAMIGDADSKVGGTPATQSGHTAGDSVFKNLQAIQ